MDPNSTEALKEFLQSMEDCGSYSTVIGTTAVIVTMALDSCEPSQRRLPDSIVSARVNSLRNHQSLGCQRG